MSDSNFALGFIAGEGCFSVRVQRRPNTNYIQPRFQVAVDSKDRETLVKLRECLGGVGNLTDRSNGMTAWMVQSKSDCQAVRDFIRENTTDLWEVTDKAENFEVWCGIVDIHQQSSGREARIEMAERARELNRGSCGHDVDWDLVIEEI